MPSRCFDGYDDPIIYRSRAEACGSVTGLRSTFREGAKTIRRRDDRRRIRRFVSDGCLAVTLIGLLLVGLLFIAVGIVGVLR